MHYLPSKPAPYFERRHAVRDDLEVTLNVSREAEALYRWTVFVEGRLTGDGWAEGEDDAWNVAFAVADVCKNCEGMGDVPDKDYPEDVRFGCLQCSGTGRYSPR